MISVLFLKGLTSFMFATLAFSHSSFVTVQVEDTTVTGVTEYTVGETVVVVDVVVVVEGSLVFAVVEDGVVDVVVVEGVVEDVVDIVVVVGTRAMGI